MAIPAQNTNPPLRLLAAFQEHYPALSPTYVVQAPGREMWVAASIEQAEAFTIHVPDTGAYTTFNRRTAKTFRTLLKRPLPRWARYPAGVILILSNAGLAVDGVSAVIVGEESPGPRYDYALGMTIAALVYTVNGQPFDTGDLLEVMDKVRRDYVGEKL